MKTRIDALDVARGAAIVAMAAYHLAWDLWWFGFLPYDMIGGGIAIVSRTLIAGSFIFLVGVSLELATRSGIRWRPFLRRFAMIVAAAAAITLVTYPIFPESWIFFGVLHLIAFASIVGLAVRRLHPALLMALSAAALILPRMVEAPLFDAPLLTFLGLTDRPIVANDFVPVFPWIAPMFAGLAAGQLWLLRPVGWSWRADGMPVRGLAFLGRHALAVYLLHQPVLYGIVWGAFLVYAEIVYGG